MSESKTDKAEAHAATLRSFVASGGVVFLLSTDTIFAEVLRRALEMAKTSRQGVRHHRNVDTFLFDLRQESQNRVVVFVERVLSGQSLAPLLGSIGQICHDAAIIVLTTEIDQETAALLIEYGAHNIITKPISVALVLEKMATTIAPQSQIGRSLERARRSIEMGSYEEALRIASVVLQMRPENAAAYTIMGDAYKGMGMGSKAEEMYVKASSISNLYIQPLKRLSSLYEEFGDKRKHLDTLRRLHAISPLNTQRLLDMGSLEMEIGDPKQAEEYFEQAMQAARREAAEHLSRMSAKIAEACMAHNPAMAIRYSRLALEAKGEDLSSTDLETFNLLGLALRREGRWREAVAEYRRALAIDPNHPVVLYNLALAYAEGGSFAQAAEVLERALSTASELLDVAPQVEASARIIFSKAGRELPAVFAPRAPDASKERDSELKRHLEAMERVVV